MVEYCVCRYASPPKNDAIATPYSPIAATQTLPADLTEMMPSRATSKPRLIQVLKALLQDPGLHQAELFYVQFWGFRG